MNYEKIDALLKKLGLQRKSKPVAKPNLYIGVEKDQRAPSDLNNLHGFTLLDPPSVLHSGEVVVARKLSDTDGNVSLYASNSIAKGIVADLIDRKVLVEKDGFMVDESAPFPGDLPDSPYLSYRAQATPGGDVLVVRQYSDSGQGMSIYASEDCAQSVVKKYELSGLLLRSKRLALTHPYGCHS